MRPCHPLFGVRTLTFEEFLAGGGWEVAFADAPRWMEEKGVVFDPAVQWLEEQLFDRDTLEGLVAGRFEPSGATIGLYMPVRRK